MSQNLLVIGGSRGIGAAACEYLDGAGNNVSSVSRTPSPVGKWIKADVSTDEGIDQVLHAIGDNALDGMLYLGGIWEAGAFTNAYSFKASTRTEMRAVLSVNLLAPILLTQGLAPALTKSANPHIVLMGSTSGLDGRGSVEVANTASKFGLRGAAEAIRLSMPQLGVTVINPANIATQEVELDIAEGRFSEQEPIPMHDVMTTISYILSLSSASTIEQIDIAQRNG